MKLVPSHLILEQFPVESSTVVHEADLGNLLGSLCLLGAQLALKLLLVRLELLEQLGCNRKEVAACEVLNLAAECIK